MPAKEKEETTMEPTKTVLSGIVRFARGTATMLGLAAMIAVVLGAGTAALAAAPGDPFRLGRTNTIDAMSTLVGSGSGALFRINNEGTGPALDLRVEPGEAPMNVNSPTRVEDLNADLLDDQSASGFVSEARIYTASKAREGLGAGVHAQVVARCDSGDLVLGGGGGSSGGFLQDIPKLSEPEGQGWKVVVLDNAGSSTISAEAICADFPPLRP
jgi:hypothetical protein